MMVQLKLMSWLSLRNVVINIRVASHGEGAQGRHHTASIFHGQMSKGFGQNIMWDLFRDVRVVATIFKCGVSVAFSTHTPALESLLHSLQKIKPRERDDHQVIWKGTIREAFADRRPGDNSMKC